MSRARLVIFVALSQVACQRFVDGPGVAPCFPGRGLPEAAGARLVVVSGETLRLLTLAPEPTLELIPLPAPVRALGVVNATGDGVIGTWSDGGVTELLDVRLVPTVEVRVLASEPEASPWWGLAAPALDGVSFVMTRRDHSTGRPLRLERRELATGNIVAEVALPEGVEGMPAVSGDGERVYLTREWAANSHEAQLCTLDARTLSGLVCQTSSWAISVRPAPDGHWLYSPLNWQGLVSLDQRTLEPNGYAESFSNPTATAFSPDSRFLLVTHQSGNGTVSVYDTSTDQRCNSASTGLTPVLLALVAGGRVAVTGDYGARGLTVIDTQTMEVTARLELGAIPDQLVPLEPPPRASTVERAPELRLVHGGPEVEAEFVAADAPLDRASARAFIGDRELSELIRVEGARLKLSLGPCERYPGQNRITLSARDSNGRAAKLLVEFDEPGHEKEPFVSGVVFVTFKDDVTALDPSMKSCARALGALMSPTSSAGDPFGSYRIPSCLGVWEASDRLQECPGINSALPDFYLSDG